VHLHSSPLSIPDHALDATFSITLNTLALYQSTLWWFDALPCRTTPVGRFHHLINSCVTIFSRSLLSAHIRAVADFKAIICPLPQKFIKCADLDFTTSPAIALIQCCMPVLSFRPCGGAATLFAKLGF